MKSHARVVVIGGGIGGCSALYHLVQEGWIDAVVMSVSFCGELGCHSAPCQAGESVYRRDEVVGTITSAAWGYRLQKNLAPAYLDLQFSAAETGLEVALLGQRYPVTVTKKGSFG